MAEADGAPRFSPTGSPAASYNDPPAAPAHTALGAAVAAAVHAAAERAGVSVPVPDARLSQACADLAEIVPEEAVRGTRLDDSAVAFALQRNGLIEPGVRLLFGWGDADRPARFVRELLPALGRAVREGSATRLGVGTARRNPDGAAAIVVALQDSAVTTLPIPRSAPPGGRIVIDAVVDDRFHDPELLVANPDGAIEQIGLAPGRPGGFVGEVVCGARAGRLQIEIVASDGSGPSVLANFPVWCAAEPPRSLTSVPVPADPPLTSAADAEHRLLAAVHRERAAAGLPVLRWNDAVAAVAREYAEDMRATGLVGHISPTRGSAADRVRAAGLATRFVAENVARAYSLNEVHEALMNSPGHRANITAAAATDVGIGVAFGDDVGGGRALFITELFTAAAPRPDGPHGCQDALAGDAIDATRP